jgi:hypothetical protein
MNAHRPGPPYTAPRERRWVPALAAEVVAIDNERGDRKCQRQSGSLYKTNPCNATGTARFGETVLCAYHLARLGCWVDAGVGMRWELEPTGEDHE